MDGPNIRVNATTLRDFAGRVVQVIGKATNVDSMLDTATLDAGGQVVVTTHGPNEIVPGAIYEIIGKVSALDYKINSYSTIRLLDNLNLDVANKLASIVAKVPELFF